MTWKGVLLDQEDEDLRNYQSGYTEGYPTCWYRQQSNTLHWIVKQRMGIAPGTICDHINGNKKDCRRSNLRAVTSSENCLNRGFLRGVSYVKATGTYMTRFTYQKKVYYCGHHYTEYSAYRAYIDKYKELTGNLPRGFDGFYTEEELHVS